MSLCESCGRRGTLRGLGGVTGSASSCSAWSRTWRRTAGSVAKWNSHPFSRRRALERTSREECIEPTSRLDFLGGRLRIAEVRIQNITKYYQVEERRRVCAKMWAQRAGNEDESRQDVELPVVVGVDRRDDEDAMPQKSACAGIHSQSTLRPGVLRRTILALVLTRVVGYLVEFRSGRGRRRRKPGGRCLHAQCASAA